MFSFVVEPSDFMYVSYNFFVYIKKKTTNKGNALTHSLTHIHTRARSLSLPLSLSLSFFLVIFAFLLPFIITQAPPSLQEALQQSIAICRKLGTTADRHDEVAHPQESLVDSFSPGSFVRAIFESGGDAQEGIPPFQRGDVFCVMFQHDGGWLQVPEGFLLVSWVVHCETLPSDADERRAQALTLRESLLAQHENDNESAELDDAGNETGLAGDMANMQENLKGVAMAELCIAGKDAVESKAGSVVYEIHRGSERLGLQIAGGTSEHPGIFVKKVRNNANLHESVL